MGYFDALLRYFEFWGRTSRAQYWTFQLLTLVAVVAAMLADFGAIRTGFELDHIGLIVTFVAIFHYVPTITTTIRRLHDIGKSGWWYLLCFVPLGGFVVLYWMCRRGDMSDNDYGPPPDTAAFDGAGQTGYVPPAGRLVRMGSSSPRPSISFDPQAISTNRFI